MNAPDKSLDRLKVLINSSTPIVVIETVEELRAVGMVRVACNELNLATFEWTIASGLARSGPNSADQHFEERFEDALPPGGYDPARRSDFEQNCKAIYHSQEPAQELNTEDMLTALSSTVSLSITRAEEIADLRAWAKHRAVWASVADAMRENA
jgi:hypothetical protein